MQTIIVFAVLVAFAMAGPLVKHNGSPDDVVVVVSEVPSDNIGVDGYKFAYELSDGTKREESANVEARGAKPEDAVISVRGSYSYLAPDGLTYTVTYVADENGFQPQGAHLPVAPVA